MAQTIQEPPPAEQRSDEQQAFDTFNQIIEILLANDPGTRRHIHAAVGAFFGYDAPPSR